MLVFQQANNIFSIRIMMVKEVSESAERQSFEGEVPTKREDYFKSGVVVCL